MLARRLIAPLILAVMAILPAASAVGQAGPAMVIAARVVGDETRTRFIADITEDVEVAVFALADPYRIVIDLPEVHFQLDPDAGEEGRGLVSAYRFGLISRGMSRIVLDVTEPTRVDDFFVLPPVDGQPARLVVDLVRTTAEEFMVAAAAHRESFVPMPRPPVTTNPAGDGRIVVVIDPGHGGIDPGASGVNGTLEKDVVLAFSLELAEQLRATGRYEVVLTRDDDSFLSLNDRVEFARGLHADMFLSIHADSFQVASVRGIAVYTVSERASTQMAAEIAAGENRADVLAGVDLRYADNMVADILIDLARRETKNFSVALARDLLDRLESTNIISRNAHQEAGFVVLKAPDVPSVLIELGFLSNRQDEELLNSVDWRERTASSVVLGIDDFFATRRLAGVPAR
jgi:N-acetylmuramoyl-L-alanine amidase